MLPFSVSALWLLFLRFFGGFSGEVWVGFEGFGGGVLGGFWGGLGGFLGGFWVGQPNPKPCKA